MGMLDLRPATELELERRNLDAALEISTSQGVGHKVAAGLRNSQLYQGADYIKDYFGDQTNLTPDQANEQFSPITPFTKNISAVQADIRSEREKTIAFRQAVSEGAGLSTTAAMVAEMAGGFLDPINFIAGGLAMKATAKAGLVLGRTQRFGTLSKLLSGAAAGATTSAQFATQLVENLAVSALVEVPVGKYVRENIYGEKYGAKEIRDSVLMGTASGFFFQKFQQVLTSGARVVKNTPAPWTNRAVQEELINEAFTGKAPDIEAALTRLDKKFKSFNNNANNQAKYANVFGSFDNNTFYSSHDINIQAKGVGDGNIHIGRTFGRGLHLTSNPAKAASQLFHVPEGRVIKINLDDMKMIDTDAVLDTSGLDTVEPSHQIITDFVGRRKVAIPKDATVNNVLDKLENLDTKSGGTARLDALNDELAAADYNGYSYIEDNFRGGDFNKEAFIFNDKVVKPSTDVAVRPRAAQTTNLLTQEIKFKPDEADVADFFSNKYGDPTDPLMLESNRRATAEYNEIERLNQPFDDSPFVGGDVWTANRVIYQDMSELKPHLAAHDGIDFIESGSGVIKQLEDDLASLQFHVEVESKARVDNTFSAAGDIKKAEAKLRKIEKSGNTEVAKKLRKEMIALTKAKPKVKPKTTAEAPTKKPSTLLKEQQKAEAAIETEFNKKADKLLKEIDKQEALIKGADDALNDFPANTKVLENKIKRAQEKIKDLEKSVRQLVVCGGRNG